jgi:hypothetical protein
MPGGPKLTHKQDLAVAALLSEPTVEAAARAAVSPRTLRTWLKDPAFAAAYREARPGVLKRTVARFLAASGKAVATLEGLLDGDRPATRLAAALAILDRAVRGVELLDVAARLDALEAAAEMAQEGSGEHQAP